MLVREQGGEGARRQLAALVGRQARREAPVARHQHAVEALEQIKFLAPILPSAQVSLLLESRNGGERLRFVYSARERKFSSGTIVFGA